MLIIYKHKTPRVVVNCTAGYEILALTYLRYLLVEVVSTIKPKRNQFRYIKPMEIISILNNTKSVCVAADVL